MSEGRGHSRAPPSLEVDSALSLFFDEQRKCLTIDDETVCIRIERDISIYVFCDTLDTRSTRVMQQRLLRISSSVMQLRIARESTLYRSTRECVRQKCGCSLIDRIARTGSRTGTGRWSLTCYWECRLSQEDDYYDIRRYSWLWNIKLQWFLCERSKTFVIKKTFKD